LIRQAVYRLSQQRHLRDFATHNGRARTMALRFVAGETLDEAIAAVRNLNRQGMTATLDHLGENVSSRKEASEATQVGCEIMDTVAATDVQCNASFKLTQLGLDINQELAADNLRQIVEAGSRHDNFVRIDMESSEYVDRTLDVFFKLFVEQTNVGVVLQSMLYRSGSDLERLLEIKARVRIVKGAYLEPPSAAFQRKADVDAAFVRLMRMMLSRGEYPAIATHDESIIGETKRYAAQQGIGPERFEFQMLYGVRRDLQTRLVAEGYRVRTYVPFGNHWYPYLMRRMAERPANVMFVLGSVAREARGRGE
jgi:proline dehydrogenase